MRSLCVVLSPSCGEGNLLTVICAGINGGVPLGRKGLRNVLLLRSNNRAAITLSLLKIRVFSVGRTLASGYWFPLGKGEELFETCQNLIISKVKTQYAYA